MQQPRYYQIQHEEVSTSWEKPL